MTIFENVGSTKGVYLKEDARKKFVRALKETLQATVEHRQLKRSISYCQLPIHWWVSSPLLAPIEALAFTLLTEGETRLGKVKLTVERAEVEESPKIEGRCLFQTLSPIVASTGVRK
jgi:CRISPR-associated endoribonuclease Cas6